MLQGALAGAVAQELVKDLGTLIQEQGQYAVQFPAQFKELEEQMKFMQSFLADASRMKDKPQTVKTAITSLQELVYEADDLIADCQIREDYEEKKGSSHCFSLPELSFRIETGKKLTQITGKIGRMRQNLNSYYTPIAGHQGCENKVDRGARWSSQVFNQSEIVGLKEDHETMKKWILDQNKPLLHLGIVGMGGLGKTTLAKKIYNDAVLTRRYREKIWISVSQPVNEEGIMKSILKQLKEDDTGLKSDMLSRINEKLSDKTYLIVLDDVWSIDNGWWDNISSGLPKTQENSNCIIITSRIQNVVRQMGVEKDRVHQPRLLNDDESWELFCKVARISTNSDQTSLLEIGNDIVKKCRGLPLAIKTVGGLLSSECKKSVFEWKRIRDNFHEKLTKESNHSEGPQSSSVMASLQLSYDELPACLKPCLLCFSIYPEDREIEVDQLIRWWEGEGFVRTRNQESSSDSALDCLAELISRCLVEVAQRRNFDGSPYTCKVHDMVRDLTIKIARDEDFCSFSKNGKHISNSSSRRLGVTEDTTFQTLRGNKKLRALLLTGTDYIGFDRHIALAKVCSLRVLDLAKVKLNSICQKDLWEWITSLKRLAYLNLRGVAFIEVPESIAKLWGLQVLILGECKCLEKFPMSIVKLPRLTILDVGNCPLLPSLPQGFSRLSNLQELYGFKVGGGGNAAGSRLSDLEALTELRILQIDITKESRIEDQELKVLAKLGNLRTLSINAGENQDPDIRMKLNELTPPSMIEELYIKNYMGETTPGWMKPKSLKKVQYICIEHSRVERMSKEFWGDEECKWDVKGLCLKFCQRLTLSWEEVKAGMPEIRYLEVSQCSSLTGFPCDVTSVDFWYKDENKKDGSRKMVSLKSIESS